VWDFIDLIIAVRAALVDSAVNPGLGRSAATLGGPEADAAFLLTPNFGRHAGVARAGAAPIARPLEGTCTETALGGLRGLTDGRHKVRVGLLERSSDRWAEAASLDLSVAPFTIFATCCRSFSTAVANSGVSLCRLTRASMSAY
jgi:hypothetical protein